MYLSVVTDRICLVGNSYDILDPPPQGFSYENHPHAVAHGNITCIVRVIRVLSGPLNRDQEKGTRSIMSLRWGVCGAGKISHDFIVGLKTRPTTEHSVVAVSARSIGSAAEFAALHRIDRYYGSYEELAQDDEV